MAKPTSIIVPLALLLLLSSCALLFPPEPEPAPPPPPRPIEPALSPLPLIEIEELDVRFVQASLNQLGFNAGPIDGFWGPRSARAIRLFESAYQLASADGHISELNLTKLTEISTVRREEITISPVPSSTTGIQKKLTDQSLSDAPQLIVTDENYAILSKPNPYSDLVQQLPSGTGVYITGQQNGWYQVETLDHKIGYIQQ